MKRSTIKNALSNVVFVLAIAALIYGPSREWIMRQIAFSPSIEKEQDRETITDKDWKLIGLNTANINFEALEGEIVFVNFWATWCPSCRAEKPMMEKLYQDYKDKVAFLFVTNENWPTVQNYYSKKKYNFPTYNSQGRPPEFFTRTNSIPATYIIDKNGAVVVSKVGAADWNSKKTRQLLDDLLKN